MRIPIFEESRLEAILIGTRKPTLGTFYSPFPGGGYITQWERFNQHIQSLKFKVERREGVIFSGRTVIYSSVRRVKTKNRLNGREPSLLLQFRNTIKVNLCFPHDSPIRSAETFHLPFIHLPRHKPKFGKFIMHPLPLSRPGPI